MGRFGRVAEAFEVAAKVKDCDSSGSEHSPAETMMDLSDLVNSFIENGDGVANGDFDTTISTDECSCDDEDMEETKESLKRLFGFENCDEGRRNLILDVEKAWQGVRSSPSSLGFKRQLMARLRDLGLDAGVCKSKWEKKGRLLSGDHEFVDVNLGGSRYIIIVSLIEEFRIARPTQNYTSVLQILPQISVCKVAELKEIVRIMCKAIKKSMNQMKMSVPPWRRRDNAQAKWFGSYKRTINEFSTKNKTFFNLNNNKTVGFVSLQPTSTCHKVQDFARKNFGFKIGNLAMAMNGAS